MSLALRDPPVEPRPAQPPPVEPSVRERAIDAYEAQHWEEALRGFDEALAVAPRDAELHNYRARVLDSLGRLIEALGAIERALEIDPGNVADLKNRGVLLRRLGRLEEALSSYEAVSRLSPADDESYFRRAQLLLELERREEALECVDRALARQPNELIALNLRGMILERLGRNRQALADFERMLSLHADHVDALNNIGMLHARDGRFVEALGCYDRSLSLHADQPQAFYNRSIVRLSLGDWTRGFKEFESRWQVAPLKGAKLASAAPVWLGQSPVQGKCILVYHEQGYGDTLQFSRYVLMLQERGARVILAVPPALQRLMRSLPGPIELTVLESGVPPHDLICPLMSLALAFGTLPDNIPGGVPYLKATEEDRQTWRTRLGDSRRLRIGICWSGRRYAPVNYPRDLSLSLLAPLLTLDADFVSLQTESADDDRSRSGDFPHLNAMLTQHLGDFADTAGLIESMDLVVSVDTALAHLAGAMGKKVWLLNRYASCWRWGQSGESTPWYPTMRIFRQPSPGDWAPAIDRVVAGVQRAIVEHALKVRLAPAVGLHTTAVGASPATCPPARVAPARAGATVRETIRLVCATRLSGEEFLAKSPLGRSVPLYRTFPRRQRIELRLFKENTTGLPALYNTAIEEARHDPAVLVFIHDDVFLSDYYWADHLFEGLRAYDIVGLAGNRRRIPRQASWMYLDDRFSRDTEENLSGVIGHGQGFPNLKELSVYGEPCEECKLLDGVMLAARSEVLIAKDLRFDARFSFDFYDLDFCRQAELRGIRMGTWAVSAIHASAGKLGSPTWRAAYRVYLEKYNEA